tara:strand:- start:4530 stop:5936 length:1407 start_codon:yes stop_codon:yes gene_type:complete
MYYLFTALAVLFASCSNNDDTATAESVVVAFENPNLSFETTDASKEVNLVFSTAAPQSGTLTLTYTTENALYGDDADFITLPSGESGTITLDFEAGATGVSFTFNKLQDALEGTTKSVTFSIDSITLADAFANGNTDIVVSFTATAAAAGTFSPEVGGPNEPNQVYLDLSSLTETAVQRDSWDLAFYNGSEFRVKLNGSIFMAAAQLDATDIDAVQEADVEALKAQVAVGTFDAANTAYIDDVTGTVDGTAIAEISTTAEDNKVYLLNLGYKVGTATADQGAVALNGDSRGWMKVRILKGTDDYIVQYAALDATTHDEITIAKTDDATFNYFSFSTDALIDVAPATGKWDMVFTTFTNEIPGFGSYAYADFIAINNLDGVVAYEVDGSTIAFADFAASNVDSGSFTIDQRAIGSAWRNGGGPSSLPSIKEGVYYIVQDPDGNIYKVRFTALVSEGGERGHPALEFSLL